MCTAKEASSLDTQHVRLRQIKNSFKKSTLTFKRCQIRFEWGIQFLRPSERPPLPHCPSLGMTCGWPMAVAEMSGVSSFFIVRSRDYATFSIIYSTIQPQPTPIALDWGAEPSRSCRSSRRSCGGSRRACCEVVSAWPVLARSTK